MGKELKPKWDFREYFVIYLFIGLVVIVGIYQGYNVYLSNISEVNGTNRIDNLVGIVGVLLNFLTVIFVFLTFKSQRTENNRLKQDAEFNRVLDIVFRHLTMESQATGKSLQTLTDRLLAMVVIYDNHPKNYNIIRLIVDFFPHFFTYVDIHRIHTQLYAKLIYGRNFDKEERQLLSTIVSDKFYQELRAPITNLIPLSQNIEKILPFAPKYYTEQGSKDVDSDVNEFQDNIGKFKKEFNIILSLFTDSPEIAKHMMNDIKEHYKITAYKPL